MSAVQEEKHVLYTDDYDDKRERRFFSQSNKFKPFQENENEENTHCRPRGDLQGL